ncbi:MAG: hydantoinase/oxoprolinase family protein [Proteobacteria bacterium]|nr:hydantoinase/oxoprolinase family protein [Pseudomonadota bacterium]
MSYKIGIDVGGTFTDFLLVFEDGSSKIYKVLSTPHDPSIATMSGLKEMAADRDLSLEKFLHDVTVIVHGTTVTTNAVLTYSGARTALLTTQGLRDTLEMRRGVREEQYNNRFQNVEPLVERYLRLPIEERLDYRGQVLTPLNTEDVQNAVDFLVSEEVEAVAVCFMNSFANDRHEEQAAKIVSAKLADAYLTVSNRLLPSVRFYDRVSTTVLNSYVGPILRRYLKSLVFKLQQAQYQGILLIMQSNGGVISPDLAMEKAAATLLSGPAGGPMAGVAYTAIQGYQDCITVDMGGTSFDASLVKDRTPMVTTAGEINRLRIALPMLNVVTIGAGGGSIGWIDDGGLLKMGPQSAGANPGPACYDQGGEFPTCTDADLVLGYLDQDFFAGGRIPLNLDKARRAVEKHIAKPLKLDLYEAAAGMYNMINVNMAAAIREVSIKQGYDPRDFPLVVAGGAGPNHACMFARELEIPIMIIPRESSIFCAAGMLMSDFKHDFVRTHVRLLHDADSVTFKKIFGDMQSEGFTQLQSEGIPQDRIEYKFSLDLRYVQQYHEVNVEIAAAELQQDNFDAIADRFHRQHKSLFGYCLEDEGTAVELINIRLMCIGKTDKPELQMEDYDGGDPSGAFKKSRTIFLPLQKKLQEVDVFDGFKLKFGNRIGGPAIVEQVNTTAFVTPEYNLMVDKYGSYTMYLKGRAQEVEDRILGRDKEMPKNRNA